jgi:hypothetical protein
MHLTASSAYDLNLEPPTGTTTYTLPNGTAITEPNLNNLPDGLLGSSYGGEVNALISPGINNYVSLFTQLNRQISTGANLILSYTLAKSTQSGVDFWNQFNLGEARGLSLLDQRHRLSVASVYSPRFTGSNSTAKAIFSNWTGSIISQFNSGRPYTALVSDLNDSAANQNTANSAAGLGGGTSPGYGLAPGDGLNTYTGPWIIEADLGLQRKFQIGERNTFTFKAQVFNVLNDANYYVEAGSGINQVKYNATCNAAESACSLTLNSGVGGFQTKSSISQPNPPRIMQFSFSYSF